MDSAGNAYVAGVTTSADFPRRGAAQPFMRGDQEVRGEMCTLDDAFVSKLNPAGDALVYSTYLGGMFGDYANGIAVDSAGEAYVTGSTTSTDFPRKNAEQPSCGDPEVEGKADCRLGDAFVTKFNSAGDAFVYSTYLGGRGPDQGANIALDTAGDAYVTGYTFSTNFPTKSPEQPSCGDPECKRGDAFVTKLNSAGAALAYSTYLGGSGREIGRGIATDPPATLT